MPSGRIHTLSSLVVATVSYPTLLLSGLSGSSATGCSVGALVGILINCDADVDGGSIADFYIRVYTGKAVEMMWDRLWTPYRKVCRHRGFLSHAPIISTVLRIAYLSVFYFLISTPLRWIASLVKIDWPAFLFWAFVGLVLADSAHWGLDKLDEMLGGRL